MEQPNFQINAKGSRQELEQKEEKKKLNMRVLDGFGNSDRIKLQISRNGDEVIKILKLKTMLKTNAKSMGFY